MLLLDEHLSKRLLPELALCCPALHAPASLGRQRATGAQLCACARQAGLTIVAKDRGFIALAALRGFPLKVLLLSQGNVPSGVEARAICEATGHTRWRSSLAFACATLVKGGYVSRTKGRWSLSDEGRQGLRRPYDGQAFVAELNRRGQAWKQAQVPPPPRSKGHLSRAMSVATQRWRPPNRASRASCNRRTRHWRPN